MMLSSLMRKLLKFIFSVFRKKKNILFLTLVHLSLLSAFASRGVDLYAMAAGCLLAYHHPYGGYM
jgi:hypothetical protein